LAKYENKIVLICLTAAGLGVAQLAPVSPSTAPVLTMAHTVFSILGEQKWVVPGRGIGSETLMFLLIALYLIVVLPRIKAAAAGLTSLAIGLALVIVHFALIMTQLMRIQLIAALALFAAGYAALITKRLLVAERSREKLEIESAQSNRVLGLGYQRQGRLDAAFDYFRTRARDDGVTGLLYRLALDFERRRQFNKAESAFRRMADYNPEFREVESRLDRARAMAETVILGRAGGKPPGTTFVVPGAGVEKPMLGRYQVEKELGRSAMGTVYIGTDPKVGRMVAIKTVALSREFEADELKEAKERFIREAETAGRLNHPNIVTIFDAGEEHDLAYVAMEYLRGRDLTPYVKLENLLPLDKLLSIILRVAEALGYAHMNNIVHRGIKPANIKWEPESDTVRVADFGIARVTGSSRTRTGVVLGTPSYMSPEQVADRKIGGQSDRFSLGVTLYQLACGHLPFQGDTMAQLTFGITNEPHADIRGHNPPLPTCVAAIVNKALVKYPERRYRDGRQMAKVLRMCLRTLSSECSGPVRSAFAPPAGNREGKRWPTSAPCSRSRPPPIPAWCAHITRTASRPMPRSGWRCWPTAWAVTTRARSRAASRSN
jgi:eukaryotic-like serine/threonine-protein kinase